MTKQELIDHLNASTLLDKKVITIFLDCMADIVTGELKSGREVTLPGLGKLSVKHKAGRTGRNPKTGEEIEIPAKTVPHFSAAKALKDAVNG